MPADDRFRRDLRGTSATGRPGDPQRDRHRPGRGLGDGLLPLEPEWSADPYPIQDDLRQRCPIAHTERFGGAWLPTRYDDVAAIAYDTEHFSSRAIILSNLRPPRELAPVGGSPPISSDPPFHHDARKLLPPAFTKTAVTRRSRPRGRSATPSWRSLGTGTSSTPPPNTRSTSRYGSSPTCSASHRRTGRSSVSSSRTCWRASTGPR